MDEKQQEQFEQDLHKGESILSRADPDWEMVKNPEPILYVLAKRAVSTSNDWISGADLVEDLVPLRRKDSDYFNPHGWFGKEITDVRKGKKGLSAAIGRWAPYIERSKGQPYKYRLLPELYQVLRLRDFEASDIQRMEVIAQPQPEAVVAKEIASTVSFIYETHLQEYIERSWRDVSSKMGFAGFELADRDCGPVGIADIVAHSPASGEWVVIELKRTNVVDVAIGQITRYMSWVSQQRAAGAPVRGVLVGREFDEKTRYSARAIPALTLWKYSLSFDLQPDAPG
jgi:hypothetical protein